MLKELVKAEVIQNLMAKLYSIVKVSHSVLDLDGDLIVGIGQEGIYKNKEGCFSNCKENSKKFTLPIRLKSELIGYIATEDFFTKDEEEVKNIITYQRDLIEAIIDKNINKLSYEKKIYEQLRHKFSVNLTHEFRTPLTVILSSIYMCESFFKKTQEDSNIITYLKHIKKNTYRLLRLINNLIDMTKIDCGELILFKENNDIVSIVEDTTLRVAKYLDNKDIEITFDTDIEEKVIACDKEKIERVILNLLSNAVKFTPKGHILVKVENNNNFIKVSVEDTGIGIPEKEKEVIFEPFAQVDKRLSRIAEGSGVGLPIVKSLVEMHNGVIWVESTCGKGSKFFVELPNMILEEKENTNGKIELLGGEENTHIEFSDIYF